MLLEPAMRLQLLTDAGLNYPAQLRQSATTLVCRRLSGPVASQEAIRMLGTNGAPSSTQVTHQAPPASTAAILSGSEATSLSWGMCHNRAEVALPEQPSWTATMWWRGRSATFLGAERPSRLVGLAVAVASVALATGVIYPLEHIAPVISLGVVYLAGVVVVSVFWGLALGVATAVASAAAFNFFHLPPVGTLTLADRRDWVALVALLVVAGATGLTAEVARGRAEEADQRRREADLAALLARLLLGATRLEDALPMAAQRLAAAVGVSSAAIELRAVPADERRTAYALESEGGQVGTLLLGATLAPAEQARVAERIVPALGSILGAARDRAELQREVVETAALRRSDEMKTALLRSVSHDLRTPVTAILTAAGALDRSSASRESIAEVREVVLESGTRLWRLIEKLLDLSLLEAGQLEPRLGWYSLEEVLHEAIEQVQATAGSFVASLQEGLPLLRGDAGQLERAFVNVLENAVRYSGGQPVSVRARMVGERIRVRIVDRGPGIAPSEHERVFLPFYRSAPAPRSHHGSGLGLAIAKGFVEVNGGHIAVESLPGQGATFVVVFPLPAVSAVVPTADISQERVSG